VRRARDRLNYVKKTSNPKEVQERLHHPQGNSRCPLCLIKYIYIY
jgi:hypothetical protein